MNRAKTIIFLASMALMAIDFLSMAVLQTFQIDLFPWGDSSNANDGLHLLIVPYLLWPVILILVVVKVAGSEGSSGFII